MAIGIGVNSWVFTSPLTNDSLHLIDHAAKMGFDLFELPVEDPAHFTADLVAAALKRNQMRGAICGAFGPARDLTHENPAFHQESLDYMTACFKLGEKCGVKIFCGPMYSSVGKRRHLSPDQRKKEWALAVKGLTKAAAIAADHGITLAIEPLNRFETDLVNTARQALQMVNDIGAKNVGVHLDTFHMNIEEKSIHDAVLTAGAKLVHVHACENDRGAPGSGLVDWSALAAGLREVHYQGDLVIESFTPECQAIAAAAAIWRPLADSQDQLAKDGLAFLRTLRDNIQRGTA